MNQSVNFLDQSKSSEKTGDITHLIPELVQQAIKQGTSNMLRDLRRQLST